MESGRSHSGTPAPYGRACINCSRAKSKCILLATGHGCERCQRLRKECRPSPTVRKRNERSTASKTAQLEAKLDSLVSLLQTTGAQPNFPAELDSTTARLQQNVPASQPTPLHCAAANLPSPSSSASTSNGSSIMDVCLSCPISPEVAEKNLGIFRSQNLKNCPFVAISSHVTSQQLRQDKPFLWLCIMAVSMPGSTQRDALFSKVIELIYKEVLMNVSLSMDILLGVMTFITWTTYSKRPFLNFYSNVVIGIVTDMGINKPAPSDHSTMQAFKCALGMRQPAPTVRTIEERRATLGCFLMTSSVALTMSKIDALRWNPHMEESLTVLTEVKESPNDELLVTLVKLQLIMDKVYHHRRDGEHQTQSLLHTRSFQAQLDSVKSQIPQHLQHHTTVVLYVATAELTIHEFAIKTPAVPNDPELHRLESLFACLRACKAWADGWLSIHPQNYIGCAFTLFYQFSHTLVSLFKLSTLEDPAWDKGIVRNTANLLEILDRCIFNMKRSADFITEPEDPEWNIFEKGVKMCQSIKQSWEPLLMEVWFPSVPGNGIENEFAQPGAEISDVLPMNGLDDEFMMEFFGRM